MVGSTSSFPASQVSVGNLRRPQVTAAPLDQFEGDVLVVGVLAPSATESSVEKGSAGTDEKSSTIKLPTLGGLARQVDESLGGLLTDVISETKFSGKPGSCEIMRVIGKPDLRFKRVALYGLGEPDDDGSLKVSSVQQAASYAVSTVKSLKTKATVGLLLPNWMATTAVTASDSATVAGYADLRFKSEEDPESTSRDLQFVVVYNDDIEGASILQGDKLMQGSIIGESVILAKELVNAPPNVVNPVTLAATAGELAKKHRLDITILEKKDCEERGMGAYLGVAQGSAYPPKFIHMKYAPRGDVKKRIVLIGKGLTFDSGGYNLKAGPGSMIELMKFDMGGAAAVLGAANAVGALQPPGVEVHFIIAACENMISSEAYRPGDVLKASNGKTIEIGNTDAEGRLTLADALVYADSLGNMDYIVDLATLTGAMIISLGNDYAGLFSSDDRLADRISSSAKRVGEKLWRMPLPPEYLELTKSKIADLKNTGGRAAGSITAALFLKEFVRNTPWAHLDIAGTVWGEKEGGPTGW
eukprot:CAMPEP_0184679912 /NCGR_PEP_ID=MMETSP0312-20130426/2786_1 /TAXON_ID=31354 /ORGANISM="Compsopogon coeruleus, Strain SAG 36.94" /LENGTH=528 /DNA_ID=CAMNT_0027129675 /DNA_START=489 /DNA_END=2072 /DNA_ORIENTATION=+